VLIAIYSTFPYSATSTNYFLESQYDWASPYSSRAIRLHIIRRTGAPEAGHPFLHHPWYSTDPSEGIVWGVLASPSMQTLLGVLKRQQMEQAIGYPRYLISATGQGASSLRLQPSDPLPLSELIFLYKDDDIWAWLLANPGKDPLDLLVLEARQGQGWNHDTTPAPLSGRYPFSTERPGIAGGKPMTQGKKKITATTRATTTTSATTKKAMMTTTTTRKRWEMTRRLIATEISLKL